MCMSCPHACITPTVAPRASRTFTCEAYGKPVSSTTGKPIHVGPQQQRRPVAILQHADDAMAADLLGHREAELPQLLGHFRRGFLLLVRQLRRLMERLVKLGKLRRRFLQPIGHRLGAAGGGEGASHQEKKAPKPVGESKPRCVTLRAFIRPLLFIGAAVSSSLAAAPLI